MSELVSDEISTKYHRTMRHIYDHITSMGCICCGSTEENEQTHTQFKQLYNNTNKHIGCIAAQLLASWVDTSNLSDSETESDSDDDIPTSIQPVPQDDKDNWSSIMAQDEHRVHSLSGVRSPADIFDKILSLQINCASTWRRFKCVQFYPPVPRYKDFISKTVFGGQNIYGRRDRHDAVLFNFNGCQRIGLI